jgi:hypothetical protein
MNVFPLPDPIMKHGPVKERIFFDIERNNPDKSGCRRAGAAPVASDIRKNPLKSQFNSMLNFRAIFSCGRRHSLDDNVHGTQKG